VAGVAQHASDACDLRITETADKINIASHFIFFLRARARVNAAGK
jgi:hypothetical protein